MRPVGEPYSASDDSFLRANYLAMSSRDLGSHLERSEGSIGDRLGKLGLRRFRTVAFAPAEDAVIRTAFQHRSSVDVGKELGRDPGVIRLRARRLGLGMWKRPYKDIQDGPGRRIYKVARIDKLSNGQYRRVPEHRDIIERHIGRRLTSNERVHHINCVKRDNRIENLHLFASDAGHSRAHHSLAALIPALLECGLVEFDRVGGVYRLCETSK